jgi:hypothetical protein
MNIFIIVLALFLIILLIFYEAKFKDKIKSRLLQIALTVVFAAVISPLIFTLLSSWWSRHDRIKEAAFRRTIVEAIHNDKINTDTVRELMRLRYKEVFEASEAEAKKWVNKFLGSLSDRQLQARELELTSNELAQRLSLRWEPVYTFILASLDTRVRALSKHIDISSTVKNNVQFFTMDGTHRTQRMRTITFPNGSILAVDAASGQIVKGVLAGDPRLIFREERNGNTDIIFYLRLMQDKVMLLVDNKHKQVLKESDLEGDFLSEQNRRLLEQAVNYSIEWLIL